MPVFPRMSIDIQHENWDLLEKLPKLLQEEDCFDTPATAKVVDWREPKELKVSQNISKISIHSQQKSCLRVMLKNVGQ